MSRITTLDEFEKRYQEGLGVPMVLKDWREVTPEWLHRHGEGSGDYNPLYRDARYAADARFHSLVASPSFLFSIDFGANASIWGHIPASEVAMSDLSILYLGADIEWHLPVWVGDRVRSVQTPVEVRRSSSRQLGETLVCSGRTDYYNHRAERVATMTNHMLRFVNPGRGVDASPATDGPRVAPDPLVWERRRRGDQPLYWDDVTEGDEMPTLPKGTYTTTELYLFSYGTLTISRARQVADGTIDMGAGGRADSEYAQRNRAQAGTFDYGPQRITWLIQMVSDWMGDHGDIVTMSTQLRRPNLIGDTNTVTGRVVGVREDDGTPLVDVRVAVVNQDGAETAIGLATVRLPRRDALHTELPVFGPTAAIDDAGIYG
jgi:acyl dehydratase